MSASTIWRYTISDNIAVQIPLDPPPPWNTYRVSPDGKWIVYGGLGANPEVYLGNLIDGHTQIVGKATQAHYSWAPDSQHFFVRSAGSVLGGIDMSSFLSVCSGSGEWIDARHFTCGFMEENKIRMRMAEIDAGGVKIYDLGQDIGSDASLFIKPK